jgi:hypothetical protein
MCWLRCWGGEFRRRECLQTVCKRAELNQADPKKSLIFLHRRGGRAVEGTGLENRRGRKVTVGSNPTPSAKNSMESKAYSWAA